MQVQLVSLSGSLIAEGSWEGSAWCAELFAKAWESGTVCRLYQGEREISPWDKIETLAPLAPVCVLRSPLSAVLVDDRTLRSSASRCLQFCEDVLEAQRSADEASRRT